MLEHTKEEKKKTFGSYESYFKGKKKKE